MKFISYTATDTYYEFIGENNEKVLVPSADVILVDDESNFYSIKLIASRTTIGIVPK